MLRVHADPTGQLKHYYFDAWMHHGSWKTVKANEQPISLLDGVHLGMDVIMRDRDATTKRDVEEREAVECLIRKLPSSPARMPDKAVDLNEGMLQNRPKRDATTTTVPSASSTTNEQTTWMVKMEASRATRVHIRAYNSLLRQYNVKKATMEATDGEE